MYNIKVGGKSIGIFSAHEVEHEFNKASGSPLPVSCHAINKNGMATLTKQTRGHGFRIGDMGHTNAN